MDLFLLHFLIQIIIILVVVLISPLVGCNIEVISLLCTLYLCDPIDMLDYNSHNTWISFHTLC